VRWPLLLLFLLSSCFGADWPTFRGDAQRSGFYPSFPKGKLRLAWRKELWRELTGPRAEVIIGEGRAFFGTYAGRMYAWDATSGEQLWTVVTHGPIGHSPAYSEGALYFGSMDRRLRCVDVASGKERWDFEAGEGIWVAPCIAGDLVLFGDRAGTFHALERSTGKERWRCETAGPILTTASLSEDGQRVIFASEDMIVRCVRLQDGKLEVAVA
jgi:outer membrane protein assembly factor BamB